jgi:hypothetical protein
MHHDASFLFLCLLETRADIKLANSSLSNITNLHNINHQHLDSAWQAVAAQLNSKSWPGGTAGDPAAAEQH